MTTFNLGQFALRWFSALLLVLLTYNPAGYSMVDWVRNTGTDQLPLKVLASLILLTGYAVFARATWSSLGLVGTVLTVGMMSAVVWALVDVGWLKLDSHTLLQWTALLIAATWLAIGVSWSHIQKRISGQIDVDEVDD